MKKVLKILGLLILIAGMAAASYYLYTQGYVNYLIVTGPITIILVIVLINFILSNRSEEALYNSKLRSILKTYDSVLVKSKNLPKLDAKNIIRVDTIEDLVDAQMEIRKPIYYQEQTQSCAFVLLDNNEACIYILKQNDSVLCPVEITLNELDIKNKSEESKENISEELLKDIERTTIVRVNKNKYVKVSPIRNKKVKEEQQEQQEEKKETEEVKQQEENVKPVEQEVQEEKVKVEETKQEEKQKVQEEVIEKNEVEKEESNQEEFEQQKEQEQQEEKEYFQPDIKGLANKDFETVESISQEENFNQQVEVEKEDIKEKNDTKNDEIEVLEF